MKILFLIEEFNGGGKERRLVELLKALSKDTSFNLHLALTKPQNDYPEVNSLPITIHRLYGFSDVALVFEYRKLFRRINPQLVHAWSYKTSFYTSLLKPLYKYNFVAGFIGDVFGFSGLQGVIAKLLIFKKADVIISNSKAGLLAYRVPEEKGCVVYNGFDPERISKNKRNKLKELGVNASLKVVMLANVTPYKNYQLFVDAAQAITNQRDDVAFISIGKILPEFEGLVAPYVNNKNTNIRFLGFRPDVAELIKDCDIGLLCTYTEGVSNAIIELMGNGVPVITNDTRGGSKEIIDSNKTGIICSDDVIIEKLNNLISDASFRTKLSQNAKKKVLESLSLKSMVCEYIKLYKRF